MPKKNMSRDDIIKWATSQLIALSADLDEDTAHDLAVYMMSMEDELDFQEYITGVLDCSQTRLKEFQRAFLQKRKQAASRNASGSSSSSQALPRSQDKPISGSEDSRNTETKQQKTQNNPNSKHQSTQYPKIPPSKKISSSPNSSSNDNNIKESFSTTAQSATFPVSKISQKTFLASTSAAANARKQASRKTKTKYVNFMDPSGKSLVSELSPGRHFCECLATIHKLVNNCLQCGRIVCEQEGMGPCMTCEALVVTPDKQQLLIKNNKQAQKFLTKLMQSANIDPSVDMDVFRRSAIMSANDDVTNSLTQALARKNMLLDFDKNSAKRTRVIDDQADYFSTETNKWLSRQEQDKIREREALLRQQQKDARRNRTFTIDFAGRKLVEMKPQTVDVYAAAHAIEEADDEPGCQSTLHCTGEPDLLQNNPMIPDQIVRPTFISSTIASSQPLRNANNKGSHNNIRHKTTRVQDSGLSEMTDEGHCLSMHQPWASLLIRGIKMHEGRTWYSSHRGRLWIAAASKVPSTENISQVEQELRSIFGDNLEFPTEYPTACLLGFVDVTDVLPQEEYRNKFPTGPSASEFVFICENPHELIVKYPVKGEHKIWKLEKAMHASAKAAIVPVPCQVTFNFHPDE